MFFTNTRCQKSLNDCIIDSVLEHLNAPWFIMTNINDVHLLQTYSKEMLIISCMGPLIVHFGNVEFRYVRYVILMKSFKALNAICNSVNYEIGNLQHILLTEDSMRNQTLYYCPLWVGSYKILGQEQNEKIFANNYINMAGRAIVTQSNLLPPFNILYNDQFGKKKLEGYVANCVKTYAERHFAGLDIMSTANVLHYKELYDYVIQGIIDIPSIVIPLRHKGLSSNFSYPLEFIDECFMIPLPRAKPIKGIFFNITQWHVLLIIVLLSIIYAIFLNIEHFNTFHQIRLIDVIFSDKSIRGLLGQSFVMPQKITIFIKYVYLLIFYTNIMIMTFYTAYLQSNLISPPLEKKITNLEDIRQAGLKVAVHPRDLEDWDYNFYKNYQDILHITGDNYSDFKNLRDSMDLRYVYPVDYPSWTIYHEQQKLFQRKLFFFSKDLCISRMSLFAIPIRANLPYKEMFNQHLLDVRDTGLLQHWT
ncbi:uncharacterized protein LOC119600443 [Lucilia sericata]|uniref:uncharacterized protein LOC119600443 n=1 Tax=Lucilia sericata TaxID=13632 RepID=UPI0018A7EC16|nr:uncharacterized protein LOC119600443 [Lucilia sericata]